MSRASLASATCSKAACARPAVAFASLLSSSTERRGDHVWAERYDRDLTDIFAIQDEISKAIVDALKVKLLPEEKKAIEKRGTTNAEAYNLYLMARQYWIDGDFGESGESGG